MTNSTQYSNKPSQKFLNTLRVMAEERDVTFGYPATIAEAKKQFRELKEIPRKDRRQQRHEDRAVRDAMAERGDAARVREHELRGYGSNAHWG